MNSRTLLYILIVTLSILGIRSWYEKQYQERLIEWQKQYGTQEPSVRSTATEEAYQKSKQESQTPSLAVFDLPLVYTDKHSPTSALTDTSGLISSKIIDEITNESTFKKSFGAEIRKGMFALLSEDTSLSWPEKISLFSLKTQKEITKSNQANEDRSTRNRCTLLKAFSPGFAIYIDSDLTSQQEKALAGTLESAENNDYALIAINSNWSDPESFSIIPGKMSDEGFVTYDAQKINQDALIFRKDGQILPVGIISQLTRETTPSIYAFEKTPFFQIYFKTALKQPTKNEYIAAEEKYYTLENQYQQIVFSTKDAAIVEINLPFSSEQNTKSVVRPISYDAKMVEKSPKNAHFPIHNNTLNAHYKKAEPQLGGYYPLLRRRLMSDVADTVIAKVQPQYQSCVLIPQYREGQASNQIDSLFFSVTHITETSIEFTATSDNGQKITKRFSFPKNIDNYPYCVDVTVSIQGMKPQSQFMLTTGVPEIEWMSGTSGASIGYYHGKARDKKMERIDLPKDRFLSNTITADWALNSNGFFGLILKPLSSSSQKASSILFEKAAGSDAPSRLVELDESRSTFNEESLPGYQAAIGINPNETSSYRLYAGPLDETILTKIDASSESDFNVSFDFNKALTFQGWFTFISEPFARLLYFFMKQFHTLVGSWGLSIIFATVILRILLYPLNTWSIRSMKRMQEISPLVKAIQEKNKKDPSKAQMELMALYRDKGVNPFSGCLPLLIQMPFLIGMFDLLKSTFQLRGASFIPAWMNDLSSPDTLFELPIRLPFIGNEFHLLPILLGFIMWLQQTMSSKLPKNPNEWTEQQRQQRATGLIMTVVMTIMFYNFPSGLNVYWISSMALGIIQQWWTVDRHMKTNSSR